jgi:hypothetical protein
MFKLHKKVLQETDQCTKSSAITLYSSPQYHVDHDVQVSVSIVLNFE